mmetsp:Transcript_10994/g.16008  ORF Transcript_10994/g.16008 Transcript_10994/m.16008 type:complete len:116 (-) Transcript_10994:230-577(-)|eukprot:CAMPEP_0197247484 /NCGR_PEP_ID=MMETSP1429-20130617/29224_1 /TAXON_ID=49237 /ORGANISM="Chaetoceros  sp., Strain UNC1202" /LENGTH=115 /DNA_ID=CAMNT_0042708401 /DNA_START=44 /DNA_END=391 /DNA_ORIENTATION=+
MQSLLFLLAILATTQIQAFVPSTPFTRSPKTSLRDGNIEQIEFKIFPDGRIEETVRGVKGGDCHKITEDINNELGKVVHTKPTEEMYEQEIVIDQKVQVTNNDAGSGGWDGASSW